MRVGVAPWAGAAAALALILAACLPGADAPDTAPGPAANAEAIEVSTLAPLSAGDAPVLAGETRANAGSGAGPDPERPDLTDPVPETAAPETAAPESAVPDAAQPTPALARAQASCAAQGGRLVSLDAGRFGCQFDTGDANRRCTARGDCEGACLARSGTCAPARPLFGCHEVLNARGAPVTECRQ